MLYVDPNPPPLRHFSFHDLRSDGLSRHEIARQVQQGVLRRARNSVYLTADCPPHAFRAAQVGGLLTCTSALAQLGIFVEREHGIHVHLAANRRALVALRRPDRVHWQRLIRTPHPRSLLVEPIDALAHAVECQPPRATIASIDSALNQGLLREDDLDPLFAAVSAPKRVLRLHIDGRAEAGTETFVRLMVRALGGRVQLQVPIDGVGRVDMVVDGWLVVECDSKGFHAGWTAQLADRRRDLALAALGMASIRPAAEDILFHPETVVAAIAGLLRGVRPAR